MLRSTCPIRIPSTLPPDKRVVEFLTQQVVPSLKVAADGKRTPQEIMLASQPLLLDAENPAVGMLGDLELGEAKFGDTTFYIGYPAPPLETDHAIFQMVVSAKRARNLSRRVSTFEAGDLPPDPAALDTLDVLVLSSDRLADDPNGIAMVRDWVLRGGTLWITLDDVQARTVSAVLGDAFACTIVDRVELTRLMIQKEQAVGLDADTDALLLEEPVALVRVIPEQVTTVMTVDGWPAAFWQPFGDGRVCYTTLGPAAWIRPTEQDDPRPSSSLDETPFFPRATLVDLADSFILPRHTPLLDAATLEPLLTRQIGYRILGRGTVAAILGAFVVLLVAIAWSCHRGQVSERLLWAAPVLSLLVGALFVVGGLTTKRAVPPTAATLSRVILEPGVTLAHTTGLIAVYNQTASQEPMGARDGGRFFPDMTALRGSRRRITWSDEGVWKWDQLELPAGVRTAPFERLWQLPEAPDCRALLGPDGLHGYVGPLPLSGFSHALIAVPHQGVLTATVRDRGTFSAGLDDVMAEGQYLSGTMVDEQGMREGTVYEAVLGHEPDITEMPRTMLYAWADPVDHGFVFPQPQRRESTLFSIPLRLEHSLPDTQVAIPSPLISYRAIPGPDGKPPTAYANMTHEWIETKLPATEWLRFQMPSAVLPLEVERARLSLSIRAPSRTVEILAVDGSRLTRVAQLSFPIGSYQYTLTRPEWLKLDEAGGLRLVVRVSDDQTAEADDLMAQVVWRIQRLQLDITGRVQGD
jgi:hypothetical protein